VNLIDDHEVDRAAMTVRQVPAERHAARLRDALVQGLVVIAARSTS
jgi:hypothetical protein